MLLRTSASLPLRVSQRTSRQLNEIGQRSFANSQILLDTPESSSSKSTASHDVSRRNSSSTAARPGVEKYGESQASTPQHSPVTVALVKGFAWLMGYKSKTSTAIRETRVAYAFCAKRDIEEAKFIQNRAWHQTISLIINVHTEV